MDPVEIVRRVDALKAARSNIESIWNDVERYVMPLRVGDMYLRPISELAVRLQRDDIYDSTAIYAFQKMANAMHGTITNQFHEWYGRQFRKPALNDDKRSSEWLQDSTSRERAALYDSNFDPELSSCYQDIVGLGNFFFSTEVEEDNPDTWAGFNFTAIPIRESYFERDHRGDLYRFYRWLEWRATEIKSKFAKDGVKLPDIIEKEFAEGGDPDKRFNIIYCVYRRPGMEKNYDQPYAATQRPFGCKYVLKESKEMLGEEGGYYDMPVEHCVWDKTSGSWWGHGPGMIMAPTARYINTWLALEEMSVRKMLDPPTLAEERGLISDLDLQPGGLTIVRRKDAIKPYLSDARIDFSKMSLKELRDMIREAAHNDELQLKDSPQMSATEAQIRYELMNRVLGPTMGRILRALSSVLDRTFKAMLRNKQFDEPPALVKQEKAQMRVVYTGALMRAQKSDEIAAVERWLGQIGAAGKVYPPILNVVLWYKWAYTEAQKLGVPLSIIRSETDFQAQLEQLQRVAAQQAKNAMVQQAGEAGQADAMAKKMQQESAQGGNGADA